MSVKNTNYPLTIQMWLNTLGDKWWILFTEGDIEQEYKKYLLQYYRDKKIEEILWKKK